MKEKTYETELTIYGNKIDYNLIELKGRNPHKLKHNPNKKIIALDTETLNGYARLLCDSTNDYILDVNIDDFLYYMTKRKFENTYNFFYNLNYDINAIIKFMPLENLEELKEFNETNYKEYKIFFIPKKVFSISKGHHNTSFYDVMQFFEGSLNKNALKYLDLNKYQKNYKDIDGHILGTSKEFWDDNLPMIIDYCLNDCILTKKLAEILHNTVVKSLSLYPRRYMSKASLTKDYLKKVVTIPDIYDIPEQALCYAFNTYTGGRFEIVEKGSIGKCSMFDIKSAYPYHMKNLLDINEGKWIKVNDMNENADYGYYLVSVYAKYNKISPISFYGTGGTLTYPIISCNKYMTKHELLEYEKYIDYEILNGWEFYANKEVYPFANFIDDIYFYKTFSSCENGENDCNKNVCPCNKFSKKTVLDFQYNLNKILMNGGYGLFYEKHKEPNGTYKAGEMFNPIYATEITSRTQTQIFNYAMKDINNFVGFATDSVLFKGNPELPTGDNLGEWEREEPNKQKFYDGIVIKSGMYKLGSKLKSRGMKKGENVNTPYGEYKDIIDYIENKPNLLSYPIILNNPLSFRKALHQHKKFKQKDINVFIPETYEIDINKDIKRSWDDEFIGGYELLEKSIKSKPVIIA